MTTTYLAAPTAELDDLKATFQPVFDKVAEGNLEREKNRVFPHDQVEWLKDARFGTLRIPADQGGFGASLQQTFVLLADLGEADANLAHIWRNHLAFVEDRLNAPRSATNDIWIQRFLAGEFVGGGWTEANNVTLDQLKTKVTSEGDHWLVSGAKYYATGSLYADWLDVLGATPDGDYLTALVRRDQPGIELVDDWRGFGQQTTASGSANYANARAEAGGVFGVAERFSYQGLFYQTAMLSALTGITKATLRDGVAALKARKRNYPQGLDPVPSDDAQLLQVIGKVSAQVFAAEAALTLSSASLDRVAEAHSSGDVEGRTERLREGEIVTTQSQLAIIEAALQSTTVVFDALGASGVSTDLGLDRHWRNARTLASHNPRIYKERILGAWFVNGIDPTPNFATLGRGGQGN